MTGTSRRAFIKATTLGLATVTTPQISSAQQPPTINPSILELHNWKENNTPQHPDFVDDKHEENVDKTSWSLNAYYGSELPAAIEEATPFSSVRPLKHIWAARVTTTYPNTKRIWTEGEEAEAAANIDSTTEEAFERYMEESILAGELTFRGEWHRKAVKEGAGFLIGLVPGNIGHLISILTSWRWELQTSLTTETEHTTNISEYYLSLPISAISGYANQHVENNVALDFRGLYIDWFASDDTFYAAGGIYPEDEDRLNEQLTESFDSGVLHWNSPEIDIQTSEEYETEMIELLSQIK